MMLNIYKRIYLLLKIINYGPKFKSKSSCSM
jgi:hypothetical protein